MSVYQGKINPSSISEKKKKEEQGALAIKILKMESGLTRIHTAVLGKPVLVWKFTFVWSELSVIL